MNKSYNVLRANMSKDAQESSKSIYEMAKASLEEALEHHREEEEAKGNYFYSSDEEWLREEAKENLREQQEKLLEEYLNKVEIMTSEERLKYLLGHWDNLVNQPVLPIPESIQSADEFYEWIKSQE